MISNSTRVLPAFWDSALPSTRSHTDLICTHAEMYSLLLESYIKDPVEKHRLFHSIETVPCIKRKAQWAIKWIGR